MAKELVQLYHPDIPHTLESPVTEPRERYLESRKQKGWRIWPPRQPASKTKGKEA